MGKPVVLSEMLINGSKASFLEEEFGQGRLACTFFDEPILINESNNSNSLFDAPIRNTKVLGIAEGVLCVLDGTSRNNRFYPGYFWEQVLSNPRILHRLKMRDMQGTIGHMDKIVDTNDWALGLVSHVITEIRIDREKKLVYCRLEILDTPAGRILKALYDGDLPIYISTRGAGRLKKLPGQNMDVVDPENYFFETGDIVKDPGFLEAKVNLVEIETIKNNARISEEIIEEKIDMDKEVKPNELQVETTQPIQEGNNPEVIAEDKICVNVSPEMSMEDMIKSLLNPMCEQLKSMGSIVETLNTKVDTLSENYAKETNPAQSEHTAEVVSTLTHPVLHKTEQGEEVLAPHMTNTPPASSIVAEDHKEPDGDEDDEEKKKMFKKEIHESYAKIMEVKDAEISSLTIKLNEALKENEDNINIAERLVGEIKKFSNMIKESMEERTAIEENLTKEKSEHENTKKLLTESMFELDVRKLSEEVSISIDEAREKLKDKTLEMVKEELDKEKKDKEEKEKEEKAKEIQEGIKNVSESNENKPKVFNRFITESNQNKPEIAKKVFNRFNK